MSETGAESQPRYVLRTARGHRDRQALDHEGRLRETQGRELLRPLDRRRRAFTLHAGVTQPLEKALCRGGEEIDFPDPLRPREGLGPRHERPAPAPTTTRP